MTPTRKSGSITRLANGRVLHLAAASPSRDSAWSATPIVEPTDADGTSTAFRPYLMSRDDQESALEIAAFVGRLLAQREQPHPA